LHPVRASNCCLISSGNGAPPDRQNLSEERSKLVSLGWFMMALNSVGTPGMTVGLVCSISFRASSRMKRGMITISHAFAIAKFITTVIAKTWKNGRMPSTRSLASPSSGAHDATCITLT